MGGLQCVEVRPWVRVCGWGVGPACLEGVSEGSLCIEVGPWVGLWRGGGLELCSQEGGSEDRWLGPGAQQAPRCLSGQEKCWPHSLPFLHAPPPGLPHSHWTPNHGWVPLGVGIPPLPQGYWSHRSGLYFWSPFPPSHSLRTRVAGGGLSGQRIRTGISAGSRGPKWVGET